MRIFFEKINEKDRGFTLVETLVATSILSVAILSMLVVLSKNITNTNYAKRKIIASYLAQEGVEYLRNMRDTYVLYNATSSQVGWDAFKTNLTDVGSDCQDTVNGCYVGDLAAGAYTNPSQPMINIPVPACGASCPTMSYDSSTGKYGYVGASSGFIRKIWITRPSLNEVKVFSRVSWTQGTLNYNMVFSESLYNWVE